MNRQLKITMALQETGRILSRLGHWGIPLSIGIMAGYYISDKEIPFTPVTLGIVTMVLIASFALLPLGRLLQVLRLWILRKREPLENAWWC